METLFEKLTGENKILLKDFQFLHEKHFVIEMTLKEATDIFWLLYPKDPFNLTLINKLFGW
jgi:hypothetical protein